MNNTFYRVKKDTFLWKEGAILKLENYANGIRGYIPIEDIWNVAKGQKTEYLTAFIIEDPINEEYFERVYPDTIGGKIYRTKDQLVEAYKGAFKK